MNIRQWFTRSPRRRPGPSLKTIIAGAHLPNTSQQKAFIEQLGLRALPTLKIESPFRAIAPPDPLPPSEISDPQISSPNPSSPNREPWFSTFQLENQALRARINELENLLRWSRDRESALRQQLHNQPDFSSSNS